MFNDSKTAKDVERELASAKSHVEFKRLELALAKEHRAFWACAAIEDRPGMEAADARGDKAMEALNAHARRRALAVFGHHAALEACGARMGTRRGRQLYCRAEKKEGGGLTPPSPPKPGAVAL